MHTSGTYGARAPRGFVSDGRAADPAETAGRAVTLPPFSTVGAVLKPLLHRIRIGEGGLIGMATWAALVQTRDVAVAAGVLVLTSALLAAVYLYNDVSDRAIDSYNPAKVPEHRTPLLHYPRTFFAVALATHALVCVAAWRLSGPWAGGCAATILALNPLYSGLAKRRPGLDVVVVGIMGAAVVGFGTSSPSLLLIAGAMTAISHAFQTRGDTRADQAAGVRSSATVAAPAREAIWLALCGIFAWTVYGRLGPVGALSVLIPYLLLSRAQEANRAWGWTRAYFAIVWIAVTVQ
jgi:4-hydroxybenzoate polyprenyltransferase